MAETNTTEVKELPKKSMSRIFNRVDTVKLKLDHLYGDVPVEDRAIFELTPADPITKDGFKQVEISWTADQADICELNGISLAMMAQDWKPKKTKLPKKPKASASEKIQKKYLEQLTVVRDAELENKRLVERRSMSFLQYQKSVEASLTSESTREILAGCVKVTNYKEVYLEDVVKVLRISDKTNAEIVATMSDDFVLSAYYKIKYMSNLTNSEVLGL